MSCDLRYDESMRRNLDEVDKTTRTSGGRSGGAAAIYGFVHQLIASMTLLVEAEFGRRGTVADIDTILAILEPKAGGDLVIDGVERRVLQIKHRARTLSIGDLADAVLPDLFRAHCRRPASSYELHTTHGVSRLARAFGAALQSWKTEPTVSMGADEPHVRPTLDRLLKLHLATGAPAAAFAESFTQFISRFVIMPPVSEALARNRILAFLTQRVTYAETSDDALDQLIGYLARQSGRNDTVISVDELLARLGLPSVEDGHPGAQAGRLAQALVKALSRRNFDPAYDVRPPVTLHASNPITLIAGPSGRGKSWALYRLADELARMGRPAVLVRAADRDELNEQLRMEIAGHALLQQRPVEAGLLGETWQRMQGRPDPITVLWEGCRELVLSSRLRSGVALAEDSTS